MQHSHKTWWVYWSDSLFVAICSFFCSIIRINAIKIRIHACDVLMPSVLFWCCCCCCCVFVFILIYCHFHFVELQLTCMLYNKPIRSKLSRANGNENNIFKNKWNPVEYSKAFESVFIFFSAFSLSFFCYSFCLQFNCGYRCDFESKNGLEDNSMFGCQTQSNFISAMFWNYYQQLPS